MNLIESARERDADDQPAYPQAARFASDAQQGPGDAGLPAEAGGLYARLYDDAEEAELGSAEGCQGAPHQWLRGGELHTGRGAQSAGALGGDDPGRPGQGPPGCALPHHSRRAGHPGGGQAPAAPFEIRRQASEVAPDERKEDMSRRHRAVRRDINPDPKFGDVVLSKFMNNLMLQGKKSVAESIVYGAFDRIQDRTKQDPLGVFHQALDNVSPAIEVRSRRVGGATYQVPVEVRAERRQALAIRWLITAARGRNENTMVERLSGELLDAANNRGTAVKKREDTHRMAEANRAFSHYRW